MNIFDGSKRDRFGFDPEAKFAVPQDVGELFGSMKDVGATKEQEFDALFKAYEVCDSELCCGFLLHETP